MRTALLIIFFIVFGWLVGNRVLNAAQYIEQKLIASDGAEYDRFGISVSISGDYAIVGADGDDDDGANSGSAYIFVRNGSDWTQVAKLTASSYGGASDTFGRSVSISGNYAIVGAYADDDNGANSGSAYIFARSGNNWTQVVRLLAKDGAAGDQFGQSVSISGDYAIVGARFDDDNGNSSGSAYIFARSGSDWNQVAKLTASDGAAGDNLGISVSISGDYVILGAYGDYYSSGSAYIFKKPVGGWADMTETAKLTASDGAMNDYFGASVSISGDYSIVGAELDDDKGLSSGSAYIFARSGNNWIEVAKLTASDGADADNFGASVSISGDYVIVGAKYDDDIINVNSGSAYIFVRSETNWTEVAKLTVSDFSSDDYFGGSVSIDGATVVVGAIGNDDNGFEAGAAYVLISAGPDSHPSKAMPWIPLLLLDE